MFLQPYCLFMVREKIGEVLFLIQNIQKTIHNLQSWIASFDSDPMVEHTKVLEPQLKKNTMTILKFNHCSQKLIFQALKQENKFRVSGKIFVIKN